MNKHEAKARRWLGTYIYLLFFIALSLFVLIEMQLLIQTLNNFFIFFTSFLGISLIRYLHIKYNQVINHESNNKEQEFENKLLSNNALKEEEQKLSNIFDDNLSTPIKGFLAFEILLVETLHEHYDKRGIPNTFLSTIKELENPVGQRKILLPAYYLDFDTTLPDDLQKYIQVLNIAYIQNQLILVKDIKEFKYWLRQEKFAKNPIIILQNINVMYRFDGSILELITDKTRIILHLENKYYRFKEFLRSNQPFINLNIVGILDHFGDSKLEIRVISAWNNKY